MFKLLTDEAREQVTHEYVAHRIIVTLLAFIGVVVVGIIGLLPSYVLSSARQNEVITRSKILNDSKNKQEEVDLRAWLSGTNNKLKALSPKFDVDKPSESIEKIINEKIPGIRITNFSWKKTSDIIDLSVGGIAVDRQNLITFQDRLNSSNNFSNVTLPISNLAPGKNIDFQIKFSLKP